MSDEEIAFDDWEKEAEEMAIDHKQDEIISQEIHV
jgi:hypothetical protein